MDLAALIISFVSFGAALVSAVVAVAQRSDALKAAERAESAEAAADASAHEALNAYKRSSAALEAMALLTGPPWELTYLSGDAFLLTNASPLLALDVDLIHESTGGSIVGEYERRSIGPKSAVKFTFSFSLGSSFHRDLIVRWKRPGSNEVFEWTHPIPPKPPRR